VCRTHRTAEPYRPATQRSLSGYVGVYAVGFPPMNALTQWALRFRPHQGIASVTPALLLAGSHVPSVLSTRYSRRVRLHAASHPSRAARCRAYPSAQCFHRLSPSGRIPATEGEIGRMRRMVAGRAARMVGGWWGRLPPGPLRIRPDYSLWGTLDGAAANSNTSFKVHSPSAHRKEYIFGSAPGLQ
jgi:hypothetical protein